MMHKRLTCLLAALILAGCDIYIVDGSGGLTPVPLISAATTAPTAIPGTPTQTEFPAPQPVEPTASPLEPTAIIPPTATVAAFPYEIEIHGCDTGFDLVHGMYEVTNAYVTIRNRGITDLPNACALLRAIDEEREHPDKQRCVASLPAGYQVTEKLTVDSTFKEQSAIQVDFTSDGVVMLRVSQDGCPDVNLLAGAPSGLDVVRAIAP